MKRIIASLALISFVAVMAGCTQTTCPTYSKAPVEKPAIESEQDQNV